MWKASDGRGAALREAVLEAEGWEESAMSLDAVAVQWPSWVRTTPSSPSWLAVDPSIGGVLLRGEKGRPRPRSPAGSRHCSRTTRPFVELPLGATEDRVIGSLDMAAALAGGERTVPPGLLAAAHGGVLYVDEVNLLADHLVDTLLDVAVSG